MALGDNTTSVARNAGERGRKPYFIQHELDFAQATTDKGTALAKDDVVPGLSIPANTVVLTGGFEVTEAHAGTSTDLTLAMGVTGGDVDNFVAAFDMDAASVGAYTPVPAATAPVVVSTADTIDILIETQTGTFTGGKIRMYAVCMDIDDIGSTAADEVDRDTLA